MSRDFKGIWIPREIWLDKRLSHQEKCLWAEIHSLNDRELGGCYASNEYLLNFLDVKERVLQMMLAKLKKMGLLKTVSFDGRKRVIKAVMPDEDSCTSEVQNSAPQKCKNLHPRGEDFCTPSLYREQSLDKSIDISPIPLIRPIHQNGTKVPEKRPASSPSKSKPKPSFPAQTVELGTRILEAMKSEKPGCAVRSTPTFLEPIEKMLVEDKRDPDKMILCLIWAMRDEKFWKTKVFCQDATKHLRKHFDNWDLERNRKPEARKSKYAPGSRDEIAARMLDDVVIFCTDEDDEDEPTK